MTPKSYGFFHLNAKEGEGKDFLQALPDEESRRRVLAAEMPGTNINTGWLSALEAIWARYPDRAPAPPDIRRFRLLQSVFVYEGHYLRGDVTAEQLAVLERHLRPWERRVARAVMAVAVRSRSVLPARLRLYVWTALHHVLLHQFVAWDPPRMRGGHATLLDVYERPPAAPKPARPRLRQRLRRRIAV